MNKNIPLVIIGSARGESDTKAHVNFVFEATPHTLVDLSDYHISPYSYDSNYPDIDTFSLMTEEILNHDIIIFATPVYWYAMSGQMKSLFDRFTDLVTTQKKSGRKLKNKHIFLLAVGSDAALPEGFEIPFKNTSQYLEMNYQGSVYFSTSKKKVDLEKELKKQSFIDEIEKLRLLRKSET